MPSITFVVPVGNEDIFQKNFIASPLFADKPDFQIIAQRGFKTAGEAFNDGLDKAQSELVVFAHQDVLLSSMWARRFLVAWDRLVSDAVAVGVVGCIGITHAGEAAGHVYRHDRELFPELHLPARVETLDELLVSFRKSTGLRFDPCVPGFFCYSVDLCLQASSQGLQNFAVDAPCFHQAKERVLNLPKEFFEGRKYMMKKWKDRLPVRTLSGTLGAMPSYWGVRLKELLFRATGYVPKPWWIDLPRIDPAEILAAEAALLELEKASRLGSTTDSR